MDKDGILGILNGLNAFMKNRTNETKTEETTTENPASAGKSGFDSPSSAKKTESSPMETFPEQLSFSPKLLATISLHEKHIRNLGKKTE